MATKTKTAGKATKATRKGKGTARRPAPKREVSAPKRRRFQQVALPHIPLEAPKARVWGKEKGGFRSVHLSLSSADYEAVVALRDQFDGVSVPLSSLVAHAVRAGLKAISAKRGAEMAPGVAS